MSRLVVLPLLASTLAAGALLSGCGDSTSDTAGDGTTSSASSSASVSPSSSPTTTDGAGTSSASPTASGSSAAAQLPACGSVWTDGATLPFSYRGCVDGTTTVKAQKQPCEIGKPLVVFRNKFWAAAGGPIHEVSTTLAKDASWHRALVQCGG